MSFDEYRLTSEPLDNSKLLLRVYKRDKHLAYAVIPSEMWDDENELRSIILGMERMKKERIGAAFFHGKGGRRDEAK